MEVLHTSSGLEQIANKNNVDLHEFQKGIEVVVQKACERINMSLDYLSIPRLQANDVTVILHGSRSPKKNSSPTDKSDADVLVLGRIRQGYGFTIFEIKPWISGIEKCHVTIIDTGDLLVRLKEPGTDDDFFFMRAIREGVVVHGKLPDAVGSIDVSGDEKPSQQHSGSLSEYIGD